MSNNRPQNETGRTALPNSVDELLERIPKTDETVQFRLWLREQVDSAELTAENCADSMRWANREIAVGGSSSGPEPGWAYYIDSNDNLRAWIPGSEIRDQEEATEMLNDDLNASGINVMGLLAEDQPHPVNPNPLNIETDGGTSQSKDVIHRPRNCHDQPPTVYNVASWNQLFDREVAHGELGTGTVTRSNTMSKEVWVRFGDSLRKLKMDDVELLTDQITVQNSEKPAYEY